MEKIGGCRDFIPEYEMPEPNASCGEISELRFGSRNYDDEIVAWQRDKAIATREKKSPPPHWRTLLTKQDHPLAGCFIYNDEEDGIPYEVWNPHTVEHLIYSTPLVIHAVYETACHYRKSYDLRMSDIRPICKQLTTMYYSKYRVQEELDDAAWKPVRRHFQESVDIVAMWCVQMYFYDQEHWSGLLVKYNIMDDNWREEYERASQNAKKKGPKFVVKTRTKTEPVSSGKVERPKNNGPRFVRKPRA